MIDEATLHAWEETARELAGAAGARIAAALGGGALAVEYKSPGVGGAPPRDPVSDVDRSVEELIRDEVARRFPGHGFLGEEGTAPAELEQREVVWAVDPVDGTSNLVSGFPLVASSVAVLVRGVPVAGAVWCSVTPALRPGVVHARVGGVLGMDGTVVGGRGRAGVSRRPLVALPGALGVGRSEAGAERSEERAAGIDVRSTGSAAIDCAFVAAGALAAARLKASFAWDVAAGVVLVRAAGGEARVRDEDGWRRFERFEAAEGSGLRVWRREVAVGSERLLELVTEPGSRF